MRRAVNILDSFVLHKKKQTHKTFDCSLVFLFMYVEPLKYASTSCTEWTMFFLAIDKQQYCIAAKTVRI